MFGAAVVLECEREMTGEGETHGAGDSGDQGVKVPETQGREDADKGWSKIVIVACADSSLVGLRYASLPTLPPHPLCLSPFLLSFLSPSHPLSLSPFLFPSLYPKLRSLVSSMCACFKRMSSVRWALMFLPVVPRLLLSEMGNRLWRFGTEGPGTLPEVR